MLKHRPLFLCRLNNHFNKIISAHPYNVSFFLCLVFLCLQRISIRWFVGVGLSVGLGNLMMGELMYDAMPHHFWWCNRALLVPTAIVKGCVARMTWSLLPLQRTIFKMTYGNRPFTIGVDNGDLPRNVEEIVSKRKFKFIITDQSFVWQGSRNSPVMRWLTPGFKLYTRWLFSHAS